MLAAQEEIATSTDVIEGLFSRGWIAERQPGIVFTRGPFAAVMHGISRCLLTLGRQLSAEQLHVSSLTTRSRVGDRGVATHGFLFVKAADDAPSAAEAHDVDPEVLSPAVCYAMLEMLSGTRVVGSIALTAQAACFRNERHGIGGVGRLREFTLWECAVAGDADAVQEFQSRAGGMISDLLMRLHLPSRIAPAVDLFLGVIDAAPDRLPSKREHLVPFGQEVQLAIASINHHGTHFGERFSIRDGVDGPARSACLGVGVERLTLALFQHHGLELEKWPADARLDRLPS
ncbi:MAG TPA: hypothetical protein VI248_08780 [Kineosporiaceae bacterium]